MKPLRRALDATLGRWARHFFFIIVRSYYGLFYNVSCANKAVLQDLPGGLILCTHVSRHDGPLIAAILYASRRVRPAVHYSEYYSWLQWFPMLVSGAVPMSSPKSWSPERRAEQKDRALYILRRIIENGNLVLLFPSGKVKKQRREVIEPHFSGAYDTLRALPDAPVALIRIRGLSPHENHKYDLFWSFVGRSKGRRHVLVEIELLDPRPDTSLPLAEFNMKLEEMFNRGLQAPESQQPDGGRHVPGEPSRQ